ncbi:MAG: DUF3108 domain-containing protein [Magnetococcales bacterium]|nr:DUF3108 domain-containing protein [Magnetococcales bacterium]
MTLGWLLILSAVIGCSSAQGAEQAVGAAAEERLVFNISWTHLPVPAGEATLEYQHTDTEPQQRGGDYQIRGTLRGLGLVQTLYRINDLFLTYGTGHGRAMLTDVHIKRQGHRNKRTEYRFRRQEGVVVRTVDEQEPTTMEVAEFQVDDPLTLLYRVRSLAQLQPGLQFDEHIVDGDKIASVHLSVGEREKRLTPVGQFEVMPVYPQLPDSKLLRHKGDLTVWLTDDDRRLPVRIESKVKIGAIAVDLVAHHP